MNPRLELLQPYPFERLRALLDGVTPAALSPIRLSVGEPQHPTPTVVRDAVVAHLSGLSNYPMTAGTDALRGGIAEWYVRRFNLHRLDPAKEVLPVNGSREALFAFAQCIIDGSRRDAAVACPNPFYQIYEGAALLAGATPLFLNQTPANGFGLDLDTLTPAEWSRVQLLYVCSPANPSGQVLSLGEWERLFDHADRYGFVIASDECYSEIYYDEECPPLGILEASTKLGRPNYRNVISFTSLSKRSSVPGLRSGAVAGDAAILRQFLRYRTYHGCAMSPVAQDASVAAWRDEVHVRENRALYRAKFDHLVPMLSGVIDAVIPDGGFYLWAQVPGAWNGDEEAFTRDLVAGGNVTVLPGRYLARDAHGSNPGAGRVRIALVADLEQCREATLRILECCSQRARPQGDHVPAPS